MIEHLRLIVRHSHMKEKITNKNIVKEHK